MSKVLSDLAASLRVHGIAHALREILPRCYTQGTTDVVPSDIKKISTLWNADRWQYILRKTTAYIHNAKNKEFGRQRRKDIAAVHFICQIVTYQYTTSRKRSGKVPMHSSCVSSSTHVSDAKLLDQYRIRFIHLVHRLSPTILHDFLKVREMTCRRAMHYNNHDLERACRTNRRIASIDVDLTC